MGIKEMIILFEIMITGIGWIIIWLEYMSTSKLPHQMFIQFIKEEKITGLIMSIMYLFPTILFYIGYFIIFFFKNIKQFIRNQKDKRIVKYIHKLENNQEWS